MNKSIYKLLMVVSLLTLTTFKVMANSSQMLSDGNTQIQCKDKDSTLKIKMFVPNWQQSLKFGYNIFSLLLKPQNQMIQLSYNDSSKFFAIAGMNANVSPVAINQVGIFTTLVDLDAPNLSSSNHMTILFRVNKSSNKISVDQITGEAQYLFKYTSNECQIKQ